MSPKRSLLTAAALGAMLASGLPATTAHAAPATPDASAVRTAGGTYDLIVNGAKIGSASVSDPAYSPAVVAHPGGKLTAVIADFDGTSGKALALVGTAGSKTVHTGRVTSAAWSAERHSRLAYVSDGALRVMNSPVTVRLNGPDPKVIGWSADGTAVFAQTHPGGAHDAGRVPSVVRVDLATRHVTTVLRSDPQRALVYRDIRLVTIGGRQMFSYVRAQHVYPCGGEQTGIGLADLTGREIRNTATTTDSYRSALFSSDGKLAAVERQACVSKAEKANDKAAALARVERTNGVYIVDLGTGAARRVVAGLAVNFPLAGFTGDEVRLASSRFGDHRFATGAGTTALVDAKALDDAVNAGVTGDVSTQAKIVPNRFVHQLWDTRNEFNGNSACGPTSAVMDLAGYQLATEWGIWVDSPSRHWSPWGLYITNTYSKNSTTFNRTEPDASGRGAWTGAYGWMVLNYAVGTYWAEMTDYLQRNGAYVRTGLYDANWIRARLNEGYMVVASGDYVYGRYGHIALITGYLDDGRFYVNDPYGNGTDSSWDGQNSIYTLDYMRPKNYWAA